MARQSMKFTVKTRRLVTPKLVLHTPKLTTRKVANGKRKA